MLQKLTALLMGIGVSALLSGCASEAPGSATEHNGEAHAAHQCQGENGHSHPTEGPHGGHLIELGDEEYHAELLHDEAKNIVTVNILDKTGKQEVAVDDPEIALRLFRDGDFFTYALRPTRADGPSSEFSLADGKLCDLLLHSEEVRGRLNVTISGQEYVGLIEHHVHHDQCDGDHDHCEHEHH
jgi:hypothetical protein